MVNLASHIKAVHWAVSGVYTLHYTAREHRHDSLDIVVGRVGYIIIKILATKPSRRAMHARHLSHLQVASTCQHPSIESRPAHLKKSD